MAETSLKGIFGTERPLIGMIHLLPLPGSPRWGGDISRVVDRARREALILENAGFDGFIVENFGDAPFLPGPVAAETVAAMTLVAHELRGVSKLPMGINVLRNDGLSALSVASVAGGQFIRVNVHLGAMVTDQGIIQGMAHETLRARTRLGSDVRIFADLLVKHAAPIASVDPGLAAEELIHRGLADAIILTGPTTGRAPDTAFVKNMTSRFPEFPFILGSGLTKQSIDLGLLADGAIVGSAIKKDGLVEMEIDERAARELVSLYNERRQTG